jgi:hypothetical protein
VPQRDANVDEDGWGQDAPPVTRTQLEKVQPAYQPTKVNMRELTSQQHSSSRPVANRTDDNTGPEPVKGVYQPVGKVDIAAIRAQAKQSGSTVDDRPEIVKGAYEPVGKVDIAAIRAKAQRPSEMSPAAQTTTTSGSGTGVEAPRSLADRSAAFTQAERLTSLPKPKVSNRFGGGSTFTGTKAPTPGGFEAKTTPAAAPVGIASRTFADQGGKTPAQIWAEKKAREQGPSGSGDNISSAAFGSHAPIATQTSGGGEWKSGYSGKTWAPVQTSHTGRSAGSIGQQRTGDQEPHPQQQEEAPQSPAGGISSIRDRFSGAPPMGAPATSFDRPAPEPDVSNKPNRGMGIPIPGLPRQTSHNEHEAPSWPTPPPQPRSPTPPTPEVRSSSPIRVAMPVGRGAVTDAHDEQMSPPPVMPVRPMVQATPVLEDDEPETGPDPARVAAQTAAVSTVGAAVVETAHPGAHTGGKRALVQYDYEKAEDNEIELKEGEYVTNIEMVDEDWWVGENVRGETGLFPSRLMKFACNTTLADQKRAGNYVELVEDDEAGHATSAAQQSPTAATQPSHMSSASPPTAAAAPVEPKGGATATALYDYEAAGKFEIHALYAVDEADTLFFSPEDNELTFPDGAKITNVVRIFIALSGPLWWLTVHRNFPMKIGGMESTVAKLVFFQPITCSLMNDLACGWVCTYRSGLRA